MASDVISMAVGWYAANKAAAPRTALATYGFRRHEVVGALVNCVFLLSICFTITIEAAQRVAQYQTVAEEIAPEVNLLLVVGAVGLGINLIGLLVFSIGHDGSGHGHSHGGREAAGEDSRVAVVADVASAPASATIQRRPRWSLNIQGVLLHVAGDALGSVAVILSGLLIKYLTSPARGLADPICSLAIVALLVCGALPPLRRSIAILAQAVPREVDVANIERQLLALAHVLSVRGSQCISCTCACARTAQARSRTLPTPLQVHDLHVWQLDEKRCVGTVHLCVSSSTRAYYSLVDDTKAVFHSAGIHATTVQLEFVVATPVGDGGAVAFPCLDPLCGAMCEAAQCCE